VVPAVIPWLGGAQSDKGIEVFGPRSKEGVSQASTDGMPVADICAKPESARRPTSIGRRRVWRPVAERDAAAEALKNENAKLRKVVADLSLDKEMLQDVLRRKLLSPSGSAAR
jgi:putative transposase